MTADHFRAALVVTVQAGEEVQWVWRVRAGSSGVWRRWSEGRAGPGGVEAEPGGRSRNIFQSKPHGGPLHVVIPDLSHTCKDH